MSDSNAHLSRGHPPPPKTKHGHDFEQNPKQSDEVRTPCDHLFSFCQINCRETNGQVPPQGKCAPFNKHCRSQRPSYYTVSLGHLCQSTRHKTEKWQSTTCVARVQHNKIFFNVNPEVVFYHAESNVFFARVHRRCQGSVGRGWIW